MNWQRQPAETNKAFEAFVVYRDLGKERSLEAVARKLSKSSQLLKRWSAANNWVERAGTYDDYLAEQDRKAYEATRRKAKDERHALIRNMKAKLNEVILKLDVSDPTITEALNLLKTVLAEERAEYDDLPTQRQETKMDVKGAMVVLPGKDETDSTDT